MTNDDRKLPDANGGPRRRFISFHELMRQRIRGILLVSSLYDSFILGEDGVLYELLLNEYMGLNLSHTPEITRVSSGREALAEAASDRYDLIITTLHLEDMDVLEYARKLRESGVDKPLVLLTYDSREMSELVENHDLTDFDQVFMWQGNFRILLAIIKCIEDRLNLERDTRLAGVQSIILIEDNVKFYSSYLPIIYTQLMMHSQDVIEEGINLTHRILRMRARPKIILCTTYEEAWEYFEKYHDTILGVISDVSFPRNGVKDPRAGIRFAANVKKSHADIPILLQSNDDARKVEAHEVGASFLMKKSPRLLHDVQKFIRRYFSFGDFIFYMPDGTEVARAHDLRDLEEKLHLIPDESLLFHAERNHFSNWLKARTEFYLAHQLRPRTVDDFASVDDLRQSLISSLHDYHIEQHRGRIADYDPRTFDSESGFTRIGGGSLGGKGRGLAFMNVLLDHEEIQHEFEGVDIDVPPTVILETDIFDAVVEHDDLGDFALTSNDDAEIVRRFVEAPLPKHVVDWLRGLLKIMRYPLAVRSSSLLEDSQYQPFAGVYETIMLPNNHRSLEVRLTELTSAIKRVYASTFSSHAKGYIKATPYRLEEEKMAVVVQKLIGIAHKKRFYPDFSGVARSYNFYPIEPMSSEDGIVSVALGLGAMVVEGGLTIRFCPKYPRHQVQFASARDVINFSQREFYALEIPARDADYDHRRRTPLMKLGLEVAEKDQVLGIMASTYSAENNAIYDGLSRDGLRLITFAPILKHHMFPLAEILERVLKVAHSAMSVPVEIEFSVNLSVPPGHPKEFRLLQLRPMVIRRERDQLDIGQVDPERIICRSDQVLGNGLIDNIHDIVVVDAGVFERSRTVEVAREIAQYNLELAEQRRPYLLIGIGRLGSADPWLGIPVEWDEIAGVGAIVETGFEDMQVTPSQGTHFFQNLNAFQVGYFTVNTANDGFVDWDWLASIKPLRKRKLTYHLRFDQPLEIRMNGHRNEGVILKPV